MRHSGELNPPKDRYGELAGQLTTTSDCGGCGKATRPASSLVACQPAGRKHTRDAPVHIGARFLPFDDVCSVAFGEEDTAASGVIERWEEAGRPWRPPSDETAEPLTHSSAATVSDFLTTLHGVLARTVANDHTEAAARSGEVEDSLEARRWLEMFQTWPLELAASGYAEWWLRHPRCCADATSLFAHIIQGLTREENRRKFLEKEFGAEEESASSDLQGALNMLQAIYANPPLSLGAVFETPLHHQRLFFLACRLGASRRYDVCETKKSVGELAQCLSLAATIAPRIAGVQLAMRHDLICFLGHVQREWNSLLEVRLDKMVLQVEFDQVQSLLAFAID